jgi:peroxiredoxin Q/BCP
MLKPGDRAPGFELPDQYGRKVSLEQLLAKGPVVLYFYPKDFSYGCTKEACAFRDSYEEFLKLGAAVVGVSSDDPATHAEFARSHRLPFILLSDEGGKVRRLYGVPKSFGLMPGRATFVIDTSGNVRYAFVSQLRFSAHVERALGVVRAIVARPEASARSPG